MEQFGYRFRGQGPHGGLQWVLVGSKSDPETKQTQNGPNPSCCVMHDKANIVEKLCYLLNIVLFWFWHVTSAFAKLIFVTELGLFLRKTLEVA
eukprot:3502186-Amphidinium_carterae.1